MVEMLEEEKNIYNNIRRKNSRSNKLQATNLKVKGLQ